MPIYTRPTNAVNPYATSLINDSAGSVDTISGGINMPYDFNRSMDFASQFGDPNFYTVIGNESQFDAGKQAEFAEKLRQAGYKVMQAGDASGNGAYSWVEDANGKIVAEPQYVSNDDPMFRNAMLAAAAFAGGSAAGLAGGSGAAPAAASAGTGSTGGIGGAITGDSLLAGAGLAPEAGYGLSTGAGFGGGIGAEYGALAGLGADSAAAGLVGVSSPLTMVPGSGLYSTPILSGGIGNISTDSLLEGAGLTPEQGYGIETGADLGGGIGAEYGPLTGAAADTAAAGLVGASGPLTIVPGSGLYGTPISGGLPTGGPQTPAGPATPETPAGPPAPNSGFPSLPGNVPDWLKLLVPLLGGLAAYKDAKAPKLQGYSGSIGNKTATRTTTQGKYGPISQVTYAAAGGMMPQGGIASQMPPRYLNSAQDGMADGIAAHIDGKQPAALSGGEFVIPADVVAHFGNGNSNAGAKQLYAMMERVRQARTGSPQQGKEIDPNKFMPV